MGHEESRAFRAHAPQNHPTVKQAFCAKEPVAEGRKYKYNESGLISSDRVAPLFLFTSTLKNQSKD